MRAGRKAASWRPFRWRARGCINCAVLEAAVGCRAIESRAIESRAIERAIENGKCGCKKLFAGALSTGPRLILDPRKTAKCPPKAAFFFSAGLTGQASVIKFRPLSGRQ